MWIDKITHISIYDLLKELQDDKKWLEISRQTNACIVILDNKGGSTTYGNNKGSRFYLLFYSIESDTYPIFLTKNSNQEFDMSSADLSTEFIEIIGGDCTKKTEEIPKNDKPKDDKPKDNKSKGDKPKDDKPKNDESKDDKPKNDEPKDDKPKDDKPKDDKATGKYCKLSDNKIRRRCTKTKLKSEDSDECLYDYKTNYCRIKK